MKLNNSPETPRAGRVAKILSAISLAAGLAISPACATTSEASGRHSGQTRDDLTKFCVQDCEIAQIEANLKGSRGSFSRCLEQCLDDMGIK